MPGGWTAGSDDPRTREDWSGREDLNLRPPEPHSGALPGCATPREPLIRLDKMSPGGGPASAAAMIPQAGAEHQRVEPPGWGPSVRRRASALEDVEDLFELGPQLADDLLAVVDIVLGRVIGQALAGAADGVALLVEQAADLADHDHVLALVVAAVAAALDRLELRELLLPIAQHVRLDRTQLRSRGQIT